MRRKLFNAPDGRVLASSWLGLPDLDVPSQADGWQGILSLVKELTLKNGQLYQYPVVETISLRHEKQNITLSKLPLLLTVIVMNLKLNLAKMKKMNFIYLQVPTILLTFRSK